MHVAAEQWTELLAARGTVFSLAFLTLVLAGTLIAGFGGVSWSARS